MPGDSPVRGAQYPENYLNPLLGCILDFSDIDWGNDKEQPVDLLGQDPSDAQIHGVDWHGTSTEPIHPSCQLRNISEINGNHLDSLPQGLEHQGNFISCTTSVEKRIQLEQRGKLWNEFMKAHSDFNDWLRLAESLAASPNSAHVLYVTAKEELKKFEGLQREVRARLYPLESMTQQYRCLARLYGGGWGARLRTMVQDSSQRLDHVSRTVENVCRRLKYFVSQHEEFESERENIAVWLAEMDIRLTEVEHFYGNNTSEKMRELQTFQAAVGENAERLNGLLERGERLIQRSEPGDAEEIEQEMQELLLYCARVFEGVGRLHTRLLSMRLVFEEDWLSDQHALSDCGSEGQWEDEGIYDRSSTSDPQHSLSLPAGLDANSSLDSLALEWDPSVDVGRSGSHDDADSSYFSAITGLHHVGDSLSKDARTKRQSFLDSFGSRSDMTEAETTDMYTESDVQCTGTRQSDVSVLAESLVLGVAEESPCHTSRKYLTPGGHLSEPVTFDPERISAWLGQTEPSRRCMSSVQEGVACGNAMETEENLKGCSPPQDRSLCSVPEGTPPIPPSICLSPDGCVFQSQPEMEQLHWGFPSMLNSRKRRSLLQFQKKRIRSPPLSEVKINIEREFQVASPKRASCTSRLLKAAVFFRTVKAAIFIHLLLALLLVLISQIPVTAKELSCHHANNFARSFHIMLHYINGPPPT